MHRHDSEDSRELDSQDSQAKTPKYCPNRRNSRPAWEEAPHTLPRTPFLALGRGCLRDGRGGENPTETCLVPCNGSGEPARAWKGLEPSLGHDRRGSLQRLPARVMFDLPRWAMAYPASGAAAAKTPATPTARHGPYLLVRLRVRPERHRAQSCAIALRSPALSGLPIR